MYSIVLIFIKRILLFSHKLLLVCVCVIFVKLAGALYIWLLWSLFSCDDAWLVQGWPARSFGVSMGSIDTWMRYKGVVIVDVVVLLLLLLFSYLLTKRTKNKSERKKRVKINSTLSINWWVLSFDLFYYYLYLSKQEIHIYVYLPTYLRTFLMRKYL